MAAFVGGNSHDDFRFENDSGANQALVLEIVAAFWRRNCGKSANLPGRHLRQADLPDGFLVSVFGPPTC